MTVATVVSILPVAQPVGLKGARVIPRTAEGVPSSGLTNLLLFAEAPGAGVLDRITGLRYGLDGIDGTAVLQSGGGLKVGGWNAVMGPMLQFSQPWTVALTYTRDKPAVDKSYRLLVIGGIDHAGLAVRDQMLATETNASGALSGLYVNRTINGPSQPGASASMPWPFTMRWDQTCTVFIRHNGGGDFDFIQRRGTDMSLVNAVWPLAELKGSTGAVESQQVRFGAHDNHMNQGFCTLDVGAVWNRALDMETIQVHAAAAEAIAAGRGRSI